MASLEAILLQHPFFRGLEAQLGSVVAGCCANVRRGRGEYLLHEGTPADRFYLIREGTVALEIAAAGRAPATFLTLGSGEIVGISWLTPPYRWTFDARATSLVHALAVDTACLRAKCESDHDLGYELMKRCSALLVRRLHATRLQLLDVYAGAAP